jgi:quinoprotein glucose dehydrogenase
MRRLAALAFVLFLLPLASFADDLPKPAPPPEFPDGTEKAKQNAAGFRLPKGLKVEVFATEPMLASPVAISVDEKGRVFVAEEYRFGRGAAENRNNPAMQFSFLLEDELQLKTIDDRLAMYKKWANKFDGGMNWFTKYGDQVRLIEDTKGVGRADKSSVFAAGFNHPLDGLAAGVLAHNGDVYFTCIPNLWKLRDTKNTGVADERKKLLTGFGVNCAFYGHDLHGLIFGPDGKLYFSLGDRGFNVTSQEGKHLQGLRTGAVFRCDPDGSNLEVVMRGLRNPQELAFDQYGNLFADDNNCDKGDHARLVYIVDDGDSGWNMAYQTMAMTPPALGGPWFAEKMWHLPHAGQPAWLVPPVGKIGTGPAGFLFTSGTTLPKRYENSFIMCNYAGGRGLEAFRVKPKGAGFEIDDYHDFLTPIMATDAEFGPDGKLYISDFVNLDWSGKSLGGRIYTVFDAEKVASDEVQSIRKIFAEGFGRRSNAELAKLLGHADQKVRLRAQFELAKHGRGSLEFVSIAGKSKNQLARLHAIWGLGQCLRFEPKLAADLSALLGDSDPEVRAQAAKVLGGAQHAVSADKLVELLGDSNPRVKFFAAQTLGKLQRKDAIPELFKVLAANKDEDPWLRHACVAALARIGDEDAVNAKASDPSASVRLAVVLVHRMAQARKIGEGGEPALTRPAGDVMTRLLNDSDPLVKAEAARALYDLRIDELLPEVAKTLPKLTSAADPDATVRRAINACYRVGTAEHAKLVLAAASNPTLSAPVRAEAVGVLKDWSNPPPRDRVTGQWRPLEKRDPAIVRDVVSAGFEKLLASAGGPLQVDVLGLIAPLGLKIEYATFTDWMTDTKREPAVRIAAMKVLADRKVKNFEPMVTKLLDEENPLLRAEARDVLAALQPLSVAELYAKVLNDESATLLERQRAILALPRVKSPDAGKLLDVWAAKLAAGDVSPPLRLDLVEALKAAPAAGRDKLRTKFESSLKSKFEVSLVGGDAERGREVFFGHAAAQCVRCHVVNGTGGTAGPDLSDVAKRYPEKTREFFLESLLTPSAKIAPGFGTVTLVLTDGRTVSGVLLKEDKKSLTIQYPDGKQEVIPVEDVERRSAATSPMPAMDTTLSPREVRDVIEFLTTLKGK